MFTINQLLNLPRSHKRLIMLVADLILLPLAWWIALALRHGNPWPAVMRDNLWLFIAVAAIGIPIFIRFGLYRAIVRYIGERIIIAVAQGVALTTACLAFFTLLTRTEGIPRTSFFIFFVTAFLLIAGSRFVVRSYYRAVYGINSNPKLVAIYGAEELGVQVASALLHSNNVLPVAFVDDNPVLHGSTVSGIVVYNPVDLPKLIEKLHIETVLLAMPKLKRERRFEVVKSLEHLPVDVRTIPDMGDIVSGRALFNEFREIGINELLGRDPVAPNETLLHICIQNKSVLVTGAGGSIGSELCRQILLLAPKRLVLFELSECALYQIEQELLRIIKQQGLTIELLAVLGSVQDKLRVTETLHTLKIQTIYHAAAYKHVPLVEHNLIEGICNNTFGTRTVAEAAIECGVERFVLISTDKAVRPTNVMGATKRLAELVLQALNASNSKTRFCMVRFGNVLGSSGSVVPTFREQIARGGPITLTHKDIIRYFMTIPEASQLVIQAGAMGTGGDVFVLDMGPAVRIYDLARTMIRLSGLEIRDDDNPNGDLEIVITGLRPGEKLYEELLIGDNTELTEHSLIKRAYERMLPWEELAPLLSELATVCKQKNVIRARELLTKAVTGYTPNDEIVDVVWVHQNLPDPLVVST